MPGDGQEGCQGIQHMHQVQQAPPPQVLQGLLCAQCTQTRALDFYSL